MPKLKFDNYFFPDYDLQVWFTHFLMSYDKKKYGNMQM
jgi:hypothetical protein